MPTLFILIHILHVLLSVRNIISCKNAKICIIIIIIIIIIKVDIELFQIFLVVTPYSVVVAYQRFRDPWYLLPQHHTASQPRRAPFETSPS
jgi:hypothetical protein